MSPLRLVIYVITMCGDPALTPAQIKTAVNAAKVAANASKDYDVEYYCALIIARIDALVAAIPAWTATEIKDQLRGQLKALVPEVN